MNFPKLLTMTLAVLFPTAACINLPDVDTPEAISDPRVKLSEPSGKTFTNGSVDIRVELSGSTPERVELLLDGAPVAVLEPPYVFRWDTSSTPEGSHRLQVNALFKNKVYPSEAREIVVDRTGPHVLTRVPAPGAENVPVSQPIQMTFSEPIQVNSITVASVRTIVGGLNVVREVVVSPDAQELTMHLSSMPPLPAAPQVVLTDAIVDLAGNALQVPESTWEWQVPAWLPTAHLFVGDHTLGAVDLSMGLSPSGQTYAAWMNEDGHVVVRQGVGDAWQSLDFEDGYNPGVVGPTALRFELDATGSPWLAWSGMDGAIHLLKWTGGEWKLPAASMEPIATGETTLKLFGFKTIDGEVFTVSIGWDRSTSFYQMYVHHWSQAHGWQLLDDGSLPGEAGTEGNFPFLPSLALDSSRNPLIAWASKDGRIYVQSWSAANGTWRAVGNALGVNQNMPDARSPSIQVDAANNPVVAWREKDTERIFNIQVQRFDGTAWQSIGGSHSATPGITHAERPGLFLDSSGNPVVAWKESSDSGPKIHIRRWVGTDWVSVGTPLIGRQTEPETQSASLIVGDGGFLSVGLIENVGSGAMPRVYRLNQ